MVYGVVWWGMPWDGIAGAVLPIGRDDDDSLGVRIKT